MRWEAHAAVIMKSEMHFLALTLLLAFFPAAVAAAQAGDDLVREILGADDPARSDPEAVVTVWEIRYSLSENIEVAWIESLLDVKKGARLSVGELDGLLARSRRKLEATRRFSRVNVHALPPVLDPLKRTVVVELREAFGYGFYFQPWDVSVGFYRLFRADKTLILTLGANTQEVIYYDPALGYSRFFFLADVFNVISLYENAYLKDTLGAVFRLGFNLTENFALYAASGLNGHFFPESYFLYPGFANNLTPTEREARGIANPRLILRESLGLLLDFFKPYDESALGFKGHFNINYFYSLDAPATSYFSLNVDLKLFILPAEWLIFMARNALGVHPAHTYGYLQYEVGALFRGVPRAGLADVIEAVRVELALRRLLTLKVFGVKAVDFLPFVFSDFVAYAEDVGGFNLNDFLSGVESAVGGGVYVYFMTPVNMYVTLGASLSPANGNRVRFFYGFSTELY